MTTLRASRARIPAAVFNRVARRRQRIRIARRGGDVVYLISAEDLALLRALEDRYWADESRAARERFKASGERAIPCEGTKAKLRR